MGADEIGGRDEMEVKVWVRGKQNKQKRLASEKKPIPGQLSEGDMEKYATISKKQPANDEHKRRKKERRQNQRKEEMREKRNQENSSDETYRVIVKVIQVHRDPRYTKMKSEGMRR